MSSCRHLRVVNLSLLVTLLLILCAVPLKIYSVEASSSASNRGDDDLIPNVIEQLGKEYADKLNRQNKPQIQPQTTKETANGQDVPVTKESSPSSSSFSSAPSSRFQSDFPNRNQFRRPRNFYHQPYLPSSFYPSMYFDDPFANFFHRSPLFSNAFHHHSSPFQSLFPAFGSSPFSRSYSPLGFDLFDPVSDLFDLPKLMNELQMIQQQMVTPLLEQLEGEQNRGEEQKQLEGQKDAAVEQQPQQQQQQQQQPQQQQRLEQPSTSGPDDSSAVSSSSSPSSSSPYDSLFRSLLPSSLSSFLSSSPLPSPIHVDVVESPTSYIVKADIAGVKKEDLVVRIEENQLVMEAERKQERVEGEEEEESATASSTSATADNGVSAGSDKSVASSSSSLPRYRRVERSYGKIVRRLRLPADVKQEEVKAKYENGVLTVELPRREKKAAEEGGQKIKIE